MDSNSSKRVLVVEDDDTLQAALQYNLGKEGYCVIGATDGEMALEMARLRNPTVIILDVMIPKLDGLEVCRILRSEMTVPILILTARDQEIDKVSGLDLGADHYMTKPFSMRELLARVRALIRRAAMDDFPWTQREILAVGDLVLNLKARTVLFKETRLDLKPKEYDLLVFLAMHPGRVFNRDQLLDEVWGINFFGDSRTVDVHVRWLREKIESEPGSPKHIITVRGTGYRFEK